MISKTAKIRLTKLIEFMEKLPRSANKHFDMSVYIAHRGDHAHEMPLKPSVKDLHTCGTSACALGWASTMPYFQRLGMSRRSSDEMRVFDLQVSQSVQLFGSFNTDETPKAWAKRARAFLKEQCR